MGDDALIETHWQPAVSQQEAVESDGISISAQCGFTITISDIETPASVLVPTSADAGMAYRLTAMHKSNARNQLAYFNIVLFIR